MLLTSWRWELTKKETHLEAGNLHAVLSRGSEEVIDLAITSLIR
jgi:hypothetical protein